VNGHRRSETGSGEQPETVNSVAELRARAELAEQRLDDLKAALAEMRQQRDDMREQRDKWETRRNGWRWLLRNRRNRPSPGGAGCARPARGQDYD
jgi:hypothetical protein